MQIFDPSEPVVIPESLFARLTSRTTIRFASRVTRFTLVRGLTLFLAVVISVYLTILVATKGAVIESEITGSKLTGWLAGVWQPTRLQSPGGNDIQDETVLIRNFRLLVGGLTLRLGDSNRFILPDGKTDVSSIILNRLPVTLLLFGTGNMLLFLFSLTLALPLSRQYGSWLDRLIGVLSPLSSIPAWIYGLVLTLIAARVFQFYPGGIFEWPVDFEWRHASLVVRHLTLPIVAVFISKFFQSVYAWRTFFLIYSSEDYVELSRAKGLSDKMIERHYILRPVLPNILTNFSLLLINIWQEAIIMELFFGVAGIGQLFYRVLQYQDMPLVVGLAVTFAYMLALIVLVLDVTYAVIDPRVKVGADQQVGALKTRRNWRARLRRLFNLSKREKLPIVHIGWKNNSSEDAKSSMHTSWQTRLRWRLEGVRHGLRLFSRYPSAVLGVLLILGLAGTSIYAGFKMPYEQVIALWNGNEDVWVLNPQKAQPEWVNWFRRNDLPLSMKLSSTDGTAEKKVEAVSEEVSEVRINFSFDYQYGEIPQDLVLLLSAEYDQKKPYVEMLWITPDGREIDQGDRIFDRQLMMRLSAEPDKDQNLPLTDAERQPLFADPNQENFTVLPGRYKLQLIGLVFEKDAQLDADLILYGKVYGLAGTDHRRRDLMIALLWGMPVALAFGVFGAFGTTLFSMLIAAVSAWFGGWVDGLIQRITEINMVLPAFPVMLMIYNFYSKSFWVILGVAILLSLFGSTVKTYRSVFMQLKEISYVEAARAYGASGWRIVFRYLVPRIIPVLVPQLVILIPGYVFLEATLAYLNMSDPLLPTWGKVLQEAISQGGLNGAYYWILEPAGLLLLTAFAFLMVGFGLERVFEPRLRDR